MAYVVMTHKSYGLRCADLGFASLRGADMLDADLDGAELEFAESAIPISPRQSTVVIIITITMTVIIEQ